MWALLVILTLAALPAEAQERAFPTPWCRDGLGHRVELGGLTCIAASCVPPYLARCEMSLNSPMWRKVQDGCPAVSAEPALERLILFDGTDPGGVHAWTPTQCLD